MKFILKTLFAILFVALSISVFSQIPELELIGNNAFKLQTCDCPQFDLSGITRDSRGDIYVIADKPTNNGLYKIDTTASTWFISSEIKFNAPRKFDCEGVDNYFDNFIIINEFASDVFIITRDGLRKKIPVNWKRNKINHKKWGNAGLEGVAYDSINNQLYLTKEREPAFIFKMDIASGKISEITKNYDYFNKISDYTDLKFENNSLYILERGLCRISKIDFTTNEVSSYSFASVFHPNQERIFEVRNYAHGLGEALLLTENQIWIGLDNNGRPITEFGKSLGLKGNKPLIAVFIRPKGF